MKHMTFAHDTSQVRPPGHQIINVVPGRNCPLIPLDSALRLNISALTFVLSDSSFIYIHLTDWIVKTLQISASIRRFLYHPYPYRSKNCKIR